MLNRLTLVNFRRHRELNINFTDGINIMRAMNEGGKSTCLEAVAYALFGSKALRTPLEQCVTWGEDIKTLKVELTITAEGKAYLYKRSKAGAEIVLNGNVFVTGQNEVTAFSAQLLGADANTASKLMFASQGAIRGSLDGGPKELSVLIEQLSSMEVFDQILESAQEKLALGSPALLEERLKGAEATLDAAMQNLPVLPDANLHGCATLALGNTIQSYEASLATLEANATTAETVWREASVLYMGRVTLESNVEKAAATLAASKVQVTALEPAASLIVTDSREALKREIAGCEDWAKTYAAYRIFSGLPSGERYVHGMAQFEIDQDACTISRQLLDTSVREVRHAMEKQNDRRLGTGNCSKCGQATGHLTHIVETNAKVDAELVTLGVQLADLQLKFGVESICGTRFKVIQDYANKLQPDFNKLAGYVTFNDETYPSTAAWIGTPPGDVGPDAGHARAALAKVEGEIKALAAAQAKLELAQEQRAKAETDLANAEQVLADHVSPTSEKIIELSEAKDATSLNFNAARGEIILAQRELAEVTVAYDNASRLWGMAQSRVDDSTKVIAECKKDLGSLAFNNNLVKRLRAIRPIVASKVWNTVLASVSVMFSQMRGEASIVTKEVGGFKVNGQAVESLSGSTLDVLGIALRCSLLRTFIPQCGLLILDEPAQGCDTTRTESMLGFLQSLGMTQTLLVTHEEISASVADNIIVL